MRLKNALLSKLFSQKQADLRTYPRFPVVHDRIGFVSIGNHPLGRIREISYGGMSVEIEDRTSTLAQVPTEKKITLQLLDGKLECLVVPKSETDRFVGFAFQHETLKTYEFLKQYIPFMKFGAALRYMIHNDEPNPKKLPPLLTQDEDIRASFDIEGYDDRQIPVGTIEMAENGVFYKLVRDPNRVHTYHSIGVGGKGGTLRPTPTVDPLVLRKTLCFLVGYACADYQIPVGRLIQSLMDLAETESYLPTYPERSQAKVIQLKTARARKGISKTAVKRNSK
jgi:hypothetical protein